MDTPSLREEVLAAYAGGPEEIVGLIERLVTGFSEQLERVVAQGAVLEVENAALRSEVQALRGRLAKDSHNSSKPPSSDGPGSPKRVPKSLRGVSGRRPGGQPGHPGASLTLVESPDAVVVQRPAACTRCGHDLGAATVVFDTLDWPTSIIGNGPPVIASAVTTLQEVSRWERWDAAEEGHGGAVRGDSTGV